MSTAHVAGAPHPSLRGVVLRYEGFQQRAGIPVVFRQLPCSFVPVVIDLDRGWTVAHRDPEGAAPLRLQSFVAGLTDGPVLVGHGGSARCLQVDLTPLGARRILGVSMVDLANRTVPIDDVLGGLGTELVQRIGDAPSWRERFALVDAELIARLNRAPDVDAGVAWSLSRINSSGGAAVIGELAADLGWSHRRLIARYRDWVGLGPKLVSRIVRFERASSLLGAGVEVAAAAAECGYFDQAHLARDVRELAGVTPTELRSGTVNSVQDFGVASA